MGFWLDQPGDQPLFPLMTAPSADFRLRREAAAEVATVSANSADIVRRDTQTDLADEMYAALGPEALPPPSPSLWGEMDPARSIENGLMAPSDFRESLLQGARVAFDRDPNAFAALPRTEEEFEEQVNRRMQRRMDDATDILARAPEGSWGAELLGGLQAGVTDPVTIMTLPLGLPATTIRGVILAEGAIGVASEALTLPGQFAQAERLGIDDPNVMLQLATAGVISGGLGGAIAGAPQALRFGRDVVVTGADRYAAYRATRFAAETEARPAGTGTLGNQTEIAAAEARLAEGQMPQPQTAPATRWAEADGEDYPLPSDATAEPPAPRTTAPTVDGDDVAFLTSVGVDGGARPDAITGLQPTFVAPLASLIRDAQAQFGPDAVMIGSGYRSPERQAELWADAVRRYGSEAAARRWVAPPGRSQHNHGNAADLRYASDEVRDWVHQNAGNYGLHFRMDHEPWHVEPITPGAASTSPPPPTTIPEGAPPDWLRIRNGIFAGESGGDYNALFGFSNRPGGRYENIRLTEMTVDEAIAFSDPSGDYGQWVARTRPDPENGVATPMGAYQIVGRTLRQAKEALGLRGDEVMTPELQDRLGVWILNTQGTGAWVGYRGPRDSFTPATGGAAATGGGTGGGFDGPTYRGYTGDNQMRYGDDQRIDVTYEVVDARLLQQASGDLQPRDRSHVRSDLWVDQTAAGLDPMLLMWSPTADRGAPVVGPDGIIESGNGRVLAINRAYDRFPDRATAYREQLARSGYTIPPDVERPVLVARRQTPFTPEQRRDFVVKAQDSGVATMTAAERARVGRQALTSEVLGRYQQGRRLADPGNRDFARAFVDTFPASQQGNLIADDKSLSSDGIRLLRDAIFARAWEADDILRRLIEEDPGELKTLLDALSLSAPDWAILRAEIEAGNIRPEMDISPFVIDAVRMIMLARDIAAKDGKKASAILDELLADIDLLSGAVALLTQALVRRFMPNGKQAPADEIGAFLSRYAREAMVAGREGGMFGDGPGPIEVLQGIDAKAFGDLTELGNARPRLAPQAAPTVAADEPGLAEFTDGAASPAARAADAIMEAELRAAVAPQAEPIAYSAANDLAEKFAADPALAAALQRMTEVPPTNLLPGYGTEAFWSGRQYLRKDGTVLAGRDEAVAHLSDVSSRLAWDEDGLPAQPVLNERHAAILIGPPASGKSTIANPLARKMRAAIVDADEAKKLIPEYRGGVGVSAVHEESSVLAAQALDRAIEAGQNLVLPKVGANPASLEQTIRGLQADGYRVDLIEVVTAPQEAVARMIGRFRNTGRLIPPEVMAAGIDGAPNTFQVLKQKGSANAYARIDNTPGLGTPRNILEDPDNLLAAFAQRDGSDRAVGAGSDVRGTAPEAPAGRDPDQALGQPATTSEASAPPGAAGAIPVARPVDPLAGASARVSGILSKGQTITNRLEGLTAAERKWLDRAFAQGLLERRVQTAPWKTTSWRLPQEGSTADWERAAVAAPPADPSRAPDPLADTRAAIRGLVLELQDATGTRTVTMDEILSDLDADDDLIAAIDVCLLGGRA